MTGIRHNDCCGFFAGGEHGKTMLNVWLCMQRPKDHEVWIFDVNKEPIYYKLAKQDHTIKLIPPRFDRKAPPKETRKQATIQWNDMCNEALDQTCVRLVGDECHNYLPKRLMVQDYGGLFTVLNQGRHKNVSFSVLSRSMGMVSSDVITQLKHVFIGQMWGKKDYDNAVYCFPKDKKIRDAIWDRITGLEKRHFYHKCDKEFAWRVCPEIEYRRVS